MRRLSHFLAMLAAAEAVRAMDIANPIAQRTSPAMALDDSQGTSPAPTNRPILRFRNAHVARQQNTITCGYLFDQRLLYPWLAIGCSGSCRTQGGYIGCETSVATACYPGTASAMCAQGGSAGARDLCCTASTGGWIPQCLTMTMMSANVPQYQMLRCGNTFYDEFNTLSLSMWERSNQVPARTTSRSSTSSSSSTTSTSTTSTTFLSFRSSSSSSSSPSSSSRSSSSSPSLSPSPSPSVDDLGQSSPSVSPTPTESPQAAAPVGAIVGGIIGGVAVIALTAGVIAWLVLRRRKEARNASGGGPHQPPNGPQPIQPYVPTSQGLPPTARAQPLPPKGGASPGIYEVPRHQPTLQAHNPAPPMAMYAAPAVVEAAGTQELGGGASPPPIYEAPAVNVIGTRNNPAQMG